MYALLLLALLGARRDMPPEKDGALFRMSGMAPRYSTLCDALVPDDMSGQYWCYEGGDGGLRAASILDGGTQSIVANGSPTKATARVCPGGNNCDSIGFTRLTATDWLTTSRTFNVTGDWSACIVARQADTASNRTYLSSTHGTNARPFSLYSLSGGNISSRAYRPASATYSEVYSSPTVYASDRAWFFVCTTYDKSADAGTGNNTFSVYVNGGLPSVNATYSTAYDYDPASQSMSIGATPSGTLPLNGDVRGAFFTETTLSATRIAAIASTIGLKASTLLRGDMGQTLTYSRASRAACSPSGSPSEITWLTNNIPCLSNGFVAIPQSTNYALYSEGFDTAATWVPYKLNAGEYPVVSADQAIAPDGSKTADSVIFSLCRAGTSDASLLYQTAMNSCPTAGQVCTGSIYGKTQDAGTASIGFYVDDSDWNVISDTTCTFTGEWSRCTIPAFTAAGSKTYTLLVGQIGDVNAHSGPQANLYLWGAQLERQAIPTGPIVTTTATASRSPESLTFTSPLTGTPTDYCLGATIDVLPNDAGFNWGGHCATGGVLTLGTYNGTTFGDDFAGLVRFTYSGSNTKSYFHIAGVDAGTAALLSESTNPSLLDGGVQRMVGCYRQGFPEIHTTSSGRTVSDGGEQFSQPQSSTDTTAYIGGFRVDGTASQTSACTRIRDICISTDLESCQ